jgi:glycosyltransferase involved in cell wall biosynthesis
MKFSLILTSYNDSTILLNSLEEINEFVDNILNLEMEYIIIDDGSSFEHKKELKKYEQKVANHSKVKFLFYYFEENQGRGAAVKKGIKLASNNFVGFIDNDLEIPFHIVLPMLLSLKKGSDLVIANRIYKMELKNIVRYIFTSGYHFLVNFLLKLPGYDTESGCKLFNREKILPLLKDTENDRWFWDTEIVYYSSKNNLKITEISVSLNKKYEIPSSVNFFKDIFEYTCNLIALWKTQKK